MKKFYSKATLLLLAALMAGGYFAYPKFTASNAYANAALQSDEALDQLRTANNLSDAFKHVAKALHPSVVSISTTAKPRNVSVRQFPMPSTPFGGGLSPFFSDNFFKEFRSFTVPQKLPGKQGLGSGIVVQDDGHILTNHHVIKEAEKIEVTLSDDRTYDATVIGSDPETDLAVLKIEASGLQPVRWADSDAAEVGEWVVAVGSPFGLNQTVTSGIVSALGRDDMGITNYENFIQTDAAINPGNSGGPLVNLKGELLGINTAIASRSGSYNGIGFAIPSSMANRVMTSIMDHGKVSRGYLGVMIQDMSEDLASSFSFDGEGVLVGDVVPGGPGDEGGLEAGDIVTELNGQPMANSNQLRNSVADLGPNSMVDLEVLRDGSSVNLQIKLGTRDATQLANWTSGEGAGSIDTKFGLKVEQPTSQIKDSLNISMDGGVLVTQVDSRSMASQVGVRQGDIIVSVNGSDIASVEDFNNAVDSADLSAGVRMRVYRDGGTRFVFMKSNK